MKTKAALIIFLALLFANISSAAAATFSQQFQNDFAANRIWLWAVEPTTTFTNVTFDSAPVISWLAPVNTGTARYLESDTGTALAPTAGLFTVDFDYTTPTFSFEWAELFWNGTSNTVLGSGTATWNGSAWGGSTVFTQGAAVVPVPASGVLLASGIVLGFGFVRRKAPTG
ncbi:MAG: hypothetical protein ACI915_000867 [Gammaproteobacteria bacterium]|jgi:hypothetical protein